MTSGIVAPLLEASPTLTPDQVKCRLLASSASLVGKNGNAAYSVFQQGVGLVNACNAVYSQAANCANQGLNIANDNPGRTTNDFGKDAQYGSPSARYVGDLASGPNPAAGSTNGSPPAVSHGRG